MLLRGAYIQRHTRTGQALFPFSKYAPVTSRFQCIRRVSVEGSNLGPTDVRCTCICHGSTISGRPAVATGLSFGAVYCCQATTATQTTARTTHSRKTPLLSALRLKGSCCVLSGCGFEYVPTTPPERSLQPLANVPATVTKSTQLWLWPQPPLAPM